MLSFALCRRTLVTLICVAAGFLAASAVPQQPAAPNDAAQTTTEVPQARPRVGIALEGGGALGFAHIGVLEWLEAHHIPIDYVSGTSMGGLVGGLYASGMSTDEIKELIQHIDWSAVLSGQVPFTALNFRRKEDKVAFPNRLEFGLKGGFSLPNGLNSGAAVGLLFDRTMLPYYDLKSFDDLPIPFRCVATNIVTGQKHVFSNGSLAQALRSTMAIPGVFAPVHHGNDIYSDGGAVDNLPVDEAKAMGANVVIASYLNSGPPTAESLTSLVGIAGRNVSVMVAANEVNSLKEATVVVSSDVSKYATLEFSKSSEIIPLGEKAAEEQASKLEKYAVSDAEWEAYMARRKARRRTKIPIPQFVEVYGMQGAQETQIEKAFEPYVGKPIDPDKLEATVAILQGTGIYSAIDYNLVDKDGKTGLLIRPLDKNYGPPLLNLGLTVLANESNNVQFGIGGRATFFNVVGPGSEARLTGSIGPIAQLYGELYKPFKVGSPVFVSPHAYLAHARDGYYIGSVQIEQYTEKRNGLGVDLGYQPNSKTEIRIGEEYQWFSEKLTIGTPSEQSFSITPLATNVKFQYFGQNDVIVPTKGSIVQSFYNYYTKRPFGSGGYSQMNGLVSHFIPIKSRGILFGIIQGGTSFGADNLGLAGLTLGGPLRLSAYAQNELLGTDYVLGQPGYLYRLARLNPVFADAVYVGGIYEIGKVYGGNAQTPTLPNDVAGLAVIKTFIGPVFGGLSIGDSDHRKWFFGLGRVF